jgi:hypothetical protein
MGADTVSKREVWRQPIVLNLKGRDLYYKNSALELAVSSISVITEGN